MNCMKKQLNLDFKDTLHLPQIVLINQYTATVFEENILMYVFKIIFMTFNYLRIKTAPINSCFNS